MDFKSKTFSTIGSLPELAISQIARRFNDQPATRQAGWVRVPHRYMRKIRQLALRAKVLFNSRTILLGNSGIQLVLT